MVALLVTLWALGWALALYYADDMQGEGWLAIFWLYKWVLPFVLIWVFK